MQEKLNPLLHQYKNKKVAQLHFHMQEEAIEVELVDAAGERTRVFFNGVSAFYFVDGEESPLFSGRQLDAISYFSTGFGEFATVDVTDPEDAVNISVPNFAVDTGKSSLYIEAASIRIDDMHLDVKRPLQ